MGPSSGVPKTYLDFTDSEAKNELVWILDRIKHPNQDNAAKAMFLVYLLSSRSQNRQARYSSIVATLALAVSIVALLRVR
jgi:hypothetical protein